ncbi:Major facilitator superfamily domain containing protein [Amanita muscaria]
MTAVFACRGWGNLAAALVSLVLVTCFKVDLMEQILAKNPQPGPASSSIDHIWRILIGLGCIPAVVGLYFRLTIPETPRFTIDIKRNLGQARADIGTSLNVAGHYDAELIRRVVVPEASLKDFGRYFSKWTNLRVLIGASYSWFAIDFAFYGLGLNTNSFIQYVVFAAPPQNLYDKLYDASINSLLVTVAGLIPGYWVAFLLIDRWGRKPIQLLGFAALSILFIVTGATFDELTNSSGQKVTVFLYCLGNFFQNFGPNTTTFIIPGGLFPTRYRSTCHGISGAIGKLGAIISLLVFYQIKANESTQLANPNQTLSHVFLILGFVMMTGIGSTLWLPETSGRTLEDLSNERQRGFVQGYAHLYDSPMRQLSS